MQQSDRIKPYFQIARIDHWFKNVFILPGIILALYDNHWRTDFLIVPHIFLALLSIGCIASSNYVLNEILDAPRDALHPVKKHRPVPSGRINVRIAYCEWILLACFGFLLSWPLGTSFTLTMLALWIMGCLYNIPPIRLKDKPYLDVLSESINNPIRLLAGWYAVGMTRLPPVSLMVAYWMLGAFFMAVKRFAEYRRINDPRRAAEYRDSFAYYTEQRLIISIVYYAVAFGLCFGVFIIRYRLELLLTIPLLAGFIGWYMNLGFLPDSPAQYPERLYKQRGFVLYVLACSLAMLFLFRVNIPALYTLFTPTIRLP
ncbi:MAG: UbiA prenyltransferase family protein [Euryarchaeota archaeon]|nr:UbiA prenyltransferase family protein [Euryarchaeota archaeon]